MKDKRSIMSERSSRSNVSVLLVHIDRLDIFKIQYTSRGFELGCEDVKEGGGGTQCPLASYKY